MYSHVKDQYTHAYKVTNRYHMTYKRVSYTYLGIKIVYIHISGVFCSINYLSDCVRNVSFNNFKYLYSSKSQTNAP